MNNEERQLKEPKNPPRPEEKWRKVKQLMEPFADEIKRFKDSREECMLDLIKRHLDTGDAVAKGFSLSLELLSEKDAQIQTLRNVIENADTEALNKLEEALKENEGLRQSGREIKEFAVLKVYHFTGRRRKKYYMYKWVRLMEFHGKLRWAAYHLTNANDQSYFLRAVANKDTRQILGTEIVQQYDDKDLQ